MPDTAHHITQRGIRRSNVFLDELDRQTYLALFLENSRRFHLRVLAYCLMTNHVHFVAVPARKDSIWKTFHRCHSVYATTFNMKHGFSGHLWQGRPYSCVLDEAHRWAAIRYVERNPVRAGMVARAEDYRWSSAPAHCGIRHDSLVDPQWPPAGFMASWKSWLRDDDNTAEMDRFIRESTFTGQPCGSEDFVRLVGHALQRELGKKKPGPKPKQTIEGATLWTSDEIRK
jgi:putative transposase